MPIYRLSLQGISALSLHGPSPAAAGFASQSRTCARLTGKDPVLAANSSYLADLQRNGHFKRLLIVAEALCRAASETSTDPSAACGEHRRSSAASTARQTVARLDGMLYKQAHEMG